MDAGISIRPVTSVAADYARPASGSVQQAVATDLMPSKTVTAAADVAKAGTDLNPSQNPNSPQNAASAHKAALSQDWLSRQIIIDPQTREVIFRVMDTRTRQIVRQVPDQALLTMRAYAKALQSDNGVLRTDSQTDLAV